MNKFSVNYDNSNDASESGCVTSAVVSLLLYLFFSWQDVADSGVPAGGQRRRDGRRPAASKSSRPRDQSTALRGIPASGAHARGLPALHRLSDSSPLLHGSCSFYHLQQQPTVCDPDPVQRSAGVFDCLFRGRRYPGGAANPVPD